MEFSLDSLDGFPEDSDVLETSEGHMTDSSTKKKSPKACVESKDKENAIVSNQECHDLDTSPETTERKGRIDNIESQTVFNEHRRVPESKISLKKYQETSSDFTRTKCEHSPSSTYSTPESADLATSSQKNLDHRLCGLKLTSNCASSDSSSADQREDLPHAQLAAPTRGDNFVSVVTHHHDLSPWERWVVQKARQERERREGKRLSDVSGQFV